MRKNTVAKIKEFAKKDVVLIAAWILAIISMFFVHPDKTYIDYIDFRTLGLLWSLMAIIQGLSENGLFQKIGDIIVGKVTKIWQLCGAMIFLCFFTSMFITNDVALITFVPLSIMILKKINKDNLIIQVVALQTIAANLGSMLTPIGNPQNLYLYGLADYSLFDFLKIMLPYSFMSAVLLIFTLFLIEGHSENILIEKDILNDSSLNIKSVVIYGLLFILALLVVLKVLPYYIVLFIVLLTLLFFDRKTILKVDYGLLLTFIGFFIFSGNVARFPMIGELLKSTVSGHEVLAGIIVSQGISNVPATLLLSGFAKNTDMLLVGVNLGGLGTLIASMASLISYKFVAREEVYIRKGFVVFFTIQNIIFLFVLSLLRLVL